MAFNFPAISLVDSITFSRFVFSVDDATSDLTGQDALSDQKVANIEFLMGVASQQIMTHIDSDIKQATYREVWDGAASDELVPRARPIISVTSIKVAANGDFSQSATYPQQVISFNRRSIALRNVSLPFGRGLIEVIYDAGYAAVPYDIQMACMLQFQWLNMQSGKSGFMRGLQTISKMNESQTKDKSIIGYGVCAEASGMLENYRRFEAPLSIMFARVN